VKQPATLNLILQWAKHFKYPCTACRTPAEPPTCQSAA
jgi:hypothetical protein